MPFPFAIFTNHCAATADVSVQPEPANAETVLAEWVQETAEKEQAAQSGVIEGKATASSTVDPPVSDSFDSPWTAVEKQSLFFRADSFGAASEAQRVTPE